MLDVVVVVLAVAEVVALLAGHQPGRVAAAVFAAAGLLVFLARRVQPLLVSVLALALLAASVAAAGRSPTVQFVAVLAAFAIVAACNTTVHGVTCLVAGLGFLGVATVAFDPGNVLGDFLLTAALCCVMWSAGWQVSRHGRTARVMELRAHTAEVSKAEALREERSRIARELHDVVSHGLSVVVVQTMAARSAVADTDADAATRHLDAVESVARDSLAEMRRMLGLLQVDEPTDSGVDATSSPALARIPVLVERARAAGVQVDDSAADLDATASPGVALAAYRIVQEAFTNVVKYAPGAQVRFALTCRDGRVCIEVANSRGASAPSALMATDFASSHGIVGMRERAELYGGTLTARPTTDGGFCVRATLHSDVPARVAPR